MHLCRRIIHEIRHVRDASTMRTRANQTINQSINQSINQFESEFFPLLQCVDRDARARRRRSRVCTRTNARKRRWLTNSIREMRDRRREIVDARRGVPPTARAIVGVTSRAATRPWAISSFLPITFPTSPHRVARRSRFTRFGILLDATLSRDARAYGLVVKYSFPTPVSRTLDEIRQ